MTTNHDALREAADQWFERTGRFYLANGHLESALKAAYMDGLSQPMPEAGGHGWRLTESQRKLVTFSLRMAAMSARQRADYCGQKGPTEHVGPLLDDAKELESIVAMLSAYHAAPEGAKPDLFGAMNLDTLPNFPEVKK